MEYSTKNKTEKNNGYEKKFVVSKKVDSTLLCVKASRFLAENFSERDKVREREKQR